MNFLWGLLPAAGEIKLNLGMKTVAAAAEAEGSFRDASV